MTWGNNEGTKGRCDAGCHGATSGPCRCMCGGRYHGASLSKGGVQERMREFGEEVLASAKARATAEGFELHARSLGELFGQGSLFGGA